MLHALAEEGQHGHHDHFHHYHPQRQHYSHHHHHHQYHHQHHHHRLQAIFHLTQWPRCIIPKQKWVMVATLALATPNTPPTILHRMQNTENAPNKIVQKWILNWPSARLDRAYKLLKRVFDMAARHLLICLQASFECKRCKRGQCVQIGLDLYCWFWVLWPLRPQVNRALDLKLQICVNYTSYVESWWPFKKTSCANKSFKHKPVQFFLRTTNRMKFGPKLLCWAATHAVVHFIWPLPQLSCLFYQFQFWLLWNTEID